MLANECLPYYNIKSKTQKNCGFFCYHVNLPGFFLSGYIFSLVLAPIVAVAKARREKTRRKS